MIRSRVCSCLMAAALGVFAMAAAGEGLSSPAPEAAAVYFVSPQNGALVSSPVTVRFGLRNMGVAPAGVERGNTGHHHLLIDVDELPDLTLPLPATEQIKHFGGGQTEVVIELEPGTHILRLLLGNHLHVPHMPPVISEPITITVK